MEHAELITFPAGVLGPDPCRLAVLARGDDFFAVSKPSGVALAPDALEEGEPSLLDALAAALRAGKPQLERLAIRHCGRVHGLDAPATGAVVIASSPEGEARLRNAAGSRRMEFVYDLVAERIDEPREFCCTLPVARHSAQPRMVVSHRTGRKCETLFTPVRELGGHVLWEARTCENRPHQIRLHAAENGLRIPGEHIYGRVSLVYLSRLKAAYRPGRGEERPLHAPLALHLREIVIKSATARVTLACAEMPRSLATMVDLLAEHGGRRRS
jgi:23S rRNA-/tRNA-specific pseudouridylate synthase